MNLPTQSCPVRRYTVSRPCARPGETDHRVVRGADGEAIGYSDNGIDASGINWGQLASTAIPLIASLF